MPWKLFFVLFCILLLSLIFWVNRDNVATISLIVTEFTGVSVLLLIVIMFLTGGVIGAIFSTMYYRQRWRKEYGTTANVAKKSDLKKEKKSKNKTQYTSDSSRTSENES